MKAFEASLSSLITDNKFRTLGLPYWNWRRSKRIPDDFLLRSMESNGKPGRVFQSLMAAKWGDAAGAARQIRAESDGVCYSTFVNPFSYSKYIDFQKSLSSEWHQQIHSSLSGSLAPDMGSIRTAAWDPIFWLHHSFVDKLLTEWVAKKSASNGIVGGTINESEVKILKAAWEKENYRFPVIVNGRAGCYTPDLESLQLDSVKPMDYEYSDYKSREDSKCGSSTGTTTFSLRQDTFAVHNLFLPSQPGLHLRSNSVRHELNLTGGGVGERSIEIAASISPERLADVFVGGVSLPPKLQVKLENIEVRCGKDDSCKSSVVFGVFVGFTPIGVASRDMFLGAIDFFSHREHSAVAGRRIASETYDLPSQYAVDLSSGAVRVSIRPLNSYLNEDVNLSVGSVEIEIAKSFDTIDQPHHH